MAPYEFVLTDVENSIWHQNHSIVASDEMRLAGSESWSIVKQTWNGGLSQGVDVIHVDSGKLKMSILPTRGMGLWQGKLDVDGEPFDIGWNSPVKNPVHPAFVELEANNGLGFLRGFGELLCRCGLASNGPPGLDEETGQSLTLHGRIANIPAHFVSVKVDQTGPGEIVVRGIVEESSLFGARLRLETEYVFPVGENDFLVRDTLTNIGGKPSEFELLYHINLGHPLLEAGSTIAVPIEEMAPRDPRAVEGLEHWNKFSAPQGDFTEQCYFFKPLADSQGKTSILLKNRNSTRGLGLKYSVENLPYFTLWKNTQAIEDGYVTGLEPAVNFPNNLSYERQQNRVPVLKPGESYRIELELSILANTSEISSFEETIHKIQSSAQPKIRVKPTEPFSPV